jgi:hypothetical protein
MIRNIFLAVFAVLVASLAVAAQLGRPEAGPTLAVPVLQTFPDLSYLFAYVAQSRGVGSANDSELSQQIASSSSVEQLRDYMADPILVVKADLLDHNGRSRLRSLNGNYPFYVLRATADSLVLLGTMFGTAYSAHLDEKQLHFEVQLNTGQHTTKTMSFLVDENALVNLSAPPPARLLSQSRADK